MSDQIDPSSSTSRPAVTITSEEEELVAESGLSNGDGGGDVEMKPVTNGTSEHQGDGLGVGQADTNGDDQMQGDGVGRNNEEEEEEEKVINPNALPGDACETLYLQNLNERVQLPVLTQTLTSLFKPYRPLLPIIAHRNVRMRGQAFVAFTDKETANKARREVNEFPLYGKAIQISFARTRSDSAVKRIDGEEGLEEHKKQRLEHKKMTRRSNPLRKKAQAKLAADESAAPAAKRQRLQMPDEYLPPNSVLFIQNLPEGTTSDDLREVFEVHAGLLEIRTIPAKKDIAFVEFGDENAATVAKEALHNFKIDGETKMKVTYAKK